MLSQPVPSPWVSGARQCSKSYKNKTAVRCKLSVKFSTVNPKQKVPNPDPIANSKLLMLTTGTGIVSILKACRSFPAG
jgi:hypothetical protein